MKNTNSSRRAFVKLVAGTAIAGSALSARMVAAQQAEKLSEDDPTAAALGYKAKTSEVDGAKYPTHNEEQVCVGCVLYQGDDPDWGGCGAFPGKLVAGQGWCVAYAPKPS